MTESEIRAVVEGLSQHELTVLTSAVRGTRIRMRKWTARPIYSLMRKKLLIASLDGKEQQYTRYDVPALVEQVLREMYTLSV